MLLTEAPERLLDRVRKLLAQAEDDSVTPAEAQAFTAKAAELMAKYGIDRALLAADRPETDQPANRILDIDNPWAREKAHLLSGLASALRCQCILLGSAGQEAGCTSSASPLTSTAPTSCTPRSSSRWRTAWPAPQVPDWSSSPRAWRRSWLLGFATAVIARVRAGRARRGTARRPGQGASGGEKHRARPRRPLPGHPPAGRSRPTRSPARRGSPTAAAGTATATARASVPTSAPPGCRGHGAAHWPAPRPAALDHGHADRNCRGRAPTSATCVRRLPGPSRDRGAASPASVLLPSG